MQRVVDLMLWRRWDDFPPFSFGRKRKNGGSAEENSQKKEVHVVFKKNSSMNTSVEKRKNNGVKNGEAPQNVKNPQPTS